MTVIPRTLLYVNCHWCTPQCCQSRTSISLRPMTQTRDATFSDGISQLTLRRTGCLMMDVKVVSLQPLCLALSNRPANRYFYNPVPFGCMWYLKTLLTWIKRDICFGRLWGYIGLMAWYAYQILLSFCLRSTPKYPKHLHFCFLKYCTLNCF